jgi:H+/Cl- antiporter ClcA
MAKCKEWLHFAVLAIIIGVFAVFFAKSCEIAFSAFMYMFLHVHYWILVIIPFGFLIITYLIKNHFPEAGGGGIPQALALNHTKNVDKISRFFVPKVILGKFIFVVLGTGLGATIGREGPTVQIGATIMILGKKTASNAKKKFLLTVGAAAGLAAAFNTPIGGVVFAFEELSRGASQKLIMPRVTGIAIAGIVAMLLAGNYSYFGIVAQDLLEYNWRVFIIALIIGVCAALCCYLFSKVVYYVTLSASSRVNRWRKSHIYINCLVFGLLVAGTGLISHGLSFGNGYVESKETLNSGISLPHAYFIYKMLGSIFSTASGVPGGYFATSLSIGSGIGSFIHDIYAVANVQQYCLLGMVAFLASVTRAPITSIVMVFQVTSSQMFTLPIMLSALTATWVSELMSRGIYDYQIEVYLKD